MNNSLSELVARVNSKISLANASDHAIIFMIGGINSSGKSTIAKNLFSLCDFYQSINLGIISKMIRFFGKDTQVSNIENFAHPETKALFDRIISFFAKHYFDTGVNALFEGVQIDPTYLLSNKTVLGGVILEVPREIAIVRGQCPKTHFKRNLEINDLPEFFYLENRKFKVISNSSDVDYTTFQALAHLESLLDPLI